VHMWQTCVFGTSTLQSEVSDALQLLKHCFTFLIHKR